MTDRNRIYAFDYVRAACCLLVVIFHVLLGLKDSGVPVADWAITLNDSMRTVRMPVFFFVSGVLYNMVFESRPERFWPSLILGLLIPYLAWSELQGMVKLLFAHGTNNPVTIADLGKILWAPIDHFWFLYCLIILRLVMRLDGGKGFVLGGLFVLSLVYYSLYKMEFVPGSIITSMVRGGLYFSVGIWFARNMNMEIFQVRKTSHFLLVATGGIFLFILARYAEWVILDESFPVAARLLEIVVEPAIGVVTLMVIALRLPAPRTTVSRSFASIAEGSLVIYIMHPMVAAISRTILIKAGITHAGLLFILGVVIATAAPAGIYFFGSRWRLLPYLALGQNRRMPQNIPQSVVGPATAGTVAP